MEGQELFDNILDSLPDDEFIVFDGFESAVIGITQNKAMIYSVSKCLDVINKGEFQSNGSRNSYEYLLNCIEEFQQENEHDDKPMPVFCYDYF